MACPLPSCGENTLLENQVFTIFQNGLQHWAHVHLMGTGGHVQHVHKVLISHLKSESATKHRNDPFRPNAMKRVCSAFTSCTDMKCYTVICMQVAIISWRCAKSPGLHTEWNKLNVETSSEILISASYKINRLWRWQVWLLGVFFRTNECNLTFSADSLSDIWFRGLFDSLLRLVDSLLSCCLPFSLISWLQKSEERKLA